VWIGRGNQLSELEPRLRDKHTSHLKGLLIQSGTIPTRHWTPPSFS